MESSGEAGKRLARKRLSSGGKGKLASPLKKRRNTRTGNSTSDPLNLSAKVAPPTNPAHLGPTLGDQPNPLPELLHHDPLNLQGKIDNFDLIVSEFNKKPHPTEKPSCSKSVKKRKRQRNKSQSSNDQPLPPAPPLSYNAQRAVYRYGNYTQYYGYRNKGAEPASDGRVKLMQEEWFRDKTVLDIGCNTGLLTIAVASLFSPFKITGIDIDKKLIRMAWKNLYRGRVSIVTPAGQPFPKSLTMRYLPPAKDLVTSSSEVMRNIEFVEGNYVPSSDTEISSLSPVYDVIMCMSVTKWIHLNWGDDGIKRLFKKIYQELKPNGILILEPQPWSSYAKRKKLTEGIFNNYKTIQLFPSQFTSYLMSPEVGFTSHTYLGKSDNNSTGFQRCIHVYKKSLCDLLPQATPTDANDCKTTPTKETTPIKGTTPTSIV